MRTKFLFAALSCATASAVLHAGALDELRGFVTQTQSARAVFSQTVIGRNGKPSQKASGTFAFQRPGRFRFVYEKPYAQTIIGDGQKLWIWDKELNQVTIKPMGDALGATPAALLTGDGQLERNFTLKDIGESDGMQWVEATPKQQEAGFEKVRIGFKAGQPLAMEVRDNFAQTTVLQFSGFERNVKFEANVFRFTPPQGADVIGE
ncbi:MAG: outer membrane lipoprotein chaperone LolA [Betaproteobacteria bacterium]|nr:outer membrane lipoprotein chaperone LolA [Betaproteobacteria bacterium]